jgi:type III pantothenate kinase
MQSGAYFGQLGAVREIFDRLQAENFPAGEVPAGEGSSGEGVSQPPLRLGTGGFAGLFEQEGVFDEVIPDLVLRGILLATRLNDPTATP